MEMNRHNAGFTLTEWLLTIGVISLVIIMSVPGLLYQLPRHRQQAVARQIAGHMRLARFAAMSEGFPVEITFEPASNRYTLWTDRNENGIREKEEVSPFPLRLPTSLLVETWPASGRFLPNGSFKAEGEHGDMLWISVYSSATEAYLALIIWPSGQIQNYKSTI
jgi:type II secretory pathway pseudopilin PulG